MIPGNGVNTSNTHSQSPTTPTISLRPDNSFLPPFVPNNASITPSSARSSLPLIEIARPPRNTRPASLRSNHNPVHQNITSVTSSRNPQPTSTRVTSPRNAIVSMDEVNSILGNSSNINSSNISTSPVSYSTVPTTSNLSNVPSINAPLPQVSNSPVNVPLPPPASLPSTPSQSQWSNPITPIPSPIPIPTRTTLPSPIPTPTPIPSQTQWSTPTPIPSPIPTLTRTPIPSPIPTPTPSPSQSQWSNPTPSPIPIPTTSIIPARTTPTPPPSLIPIPTRTTPTPTSSPNPPPTPPRQNISTPVQNNHDVVHYSPNPRPSPNHKPVHSPSVRSRIADIRTISGSDRPPSIIRSGGRIVRSPPGPIITRSNIDGVPVLERSGIGAAPQSISQSQREKSGAPMSQRDYHPSNPSNPTEYHRITGAQLDLPPQHLPTVESERLRVNMEKTGEAPETGPVTDPATGIVIPEGHILVKTDYGMYVVPKYDQMPVEEQRTHWNTFDLRFQLLNQSWGHYGMKFERPQPGETLTNVHVRYKQTVKYIMARSGADMYKLILLLCWLAIEVVCCKMKLCASGYTQSQLRMYEIYHTSLIEMGETSGFGEGWAPWVKILVISLVNGVAFVLISTFLGQGNPVITDGIMTLLSQFIMGNNATVTTNNELGVPQPTEGGVVGALAGMMGGAAPAGSPGGPAPPGEAGGLAGIFQNLNLQNLDVGNLIAQLGTAFTGRVQANAQAPPTATTTTGPVNRSAESADRRRQRRRERRMESAVQI